MSVSFSSVISIVIQESQLSPLSVPLKSYSGVTGQEGSTVLRSSETTELSQKQETAATS